MSVDAMAFSANEAAYVAGIPLKKVHRIIDAGLLGDSVKNRDGARVMPLPALVGLKLADETAGLLTLKGRRRLVRHVLDAPDAKTVREGAVSVDLRAMQGDVERRIASLEESRKMTASDKEIMGGAPCFKGTRIPVHDIAEMLANGDQAAAILSAYPSLSNEQVAAAPIYAQAYPRRGRRRHQSAWRKIYRRDSKSVELDKWHQGA